jgi:hypothetical protein
LATISLKPPMSEAFMLIGSTFQPCSAAIALVHPVEIAGEQRRLVAAGAGADLEHRRARIGRVARQHGDRERGARPRAAPARSRASSSSASAFISGSSHIARARRSRRAFAHLARGLATGSSSA